MERKWLVMSGTISSRATVDVDDSRASARDAPRSRTELRAGPGRSRILLRPRARNTNADRPAGSSVAVSGPGVPFEPRRRAESLTTKMPTRATIASLSATNAREVPHGVHQIDAEYRAHDPPGVRHVEDRLQLLARE